MNESDKILAEIKERWKNDLEFLKYDDNRGSRGILHVESTHPALDIRYLLNRLEAAEKASRGTARLNSKLYEQLQEALKKRHIPSL